MSRDGSHLGVNLTHRVHAGLSLDIQFCLGREIGILFGPSGAGKTTILRLIAGLVRPDVGSITLSGIHLFDSSRRIQTMVRRRRFSLIFQDDLLFPHLSVEQNVRFGLHHWSASDANARVAEVVIICGLSRLLDRNPTTLSGGERQRVGLARALAPRPRLLLCDEPFSALDLTARAELIGRLKTVQRAESIPILYVTHSPDEAVALGDRLFLLEEGRIIADGPPLEVLASRAATNSLRLINQFDAIIEQNGDHETETTLRITKGPTLGVPKRNEPPGASVRVMINASEIVLAQGTIGPISARNLIEGTVERVVSHGHEAEILVRTGQVIWMVAVVSSTVAALGLIEGVEVRMIIKSRSCLVVGHVSN